MRKLLLLPVFLLGLSCSIHASHPSYPDRTDYRVRNAAYELERATWSLGRDAEYAFHRSRHDKKALKEVRRLEDRARHFRRSIEHRYWDDHHGREDFGRLLEQLGRTERALQYAYAPRPLYRSLDRVRYLIGRLQYYYGGQGYYRYNRYR